MASEYYVPAGFGQAEMVEKKSRFIGRVWRTDTEQEALECIRKTREAHWDATHNVFAYRIREGNIMRYSDDGEPQGTSGVPALNVFLNESIVNFCCVVTRYFGGTLLGAGGLVRAYGHTAKLGLEAAGVSVMRLWKRFSVPCSYAQFERVRALIAEQGGQVEKVDYGANVAITALLGEQNAAGFCTALLDLTAGTAQASEQGETYMALRIR